MPSNRSQIRWTMQRCTFALATAGLAIWAWISATESHAQEVVLTLTNGMTIGPGVRGQTNQVSQDNASVLQAEGTTTKPIVVMDDGLRYTFVHQNRVQTSSERPVPLQRIITGNASERASGSHQRIAGVTAAVAVSPFDSFGRRVYSLLTARGRQDVMQGITEISPSYVRVEGLTASSSFIWDMRLALGAIPPDKLKEILLNHANRNDPQSWLDIVTLYQQARRYREAREILVLAMEQLPELDVQRNQLKQFDQLMAEMMFEEVQIRKRAGQHRLAESILRGFDRARVATETQLKIDRRIEEIQASQSQLTALKKLLDEDLAAIDAEVTRQQLLPVIEEIKQQLSLNNRERLNDYVRLRDDKELSAEQKICIAAGDWLMGAGVAEKSSLMIDSIWKSRPLIQEYLISEQAAERESILDRLSKLEAGTPRYVSRVIQTLAPPRELPERDKKSEGRYRIEVPNSGESDQPLAYWVQLPPEYDRHRSYPCVLTLHGQFADAERQLEWWTGPYESSFNMCLGEASRNGYIVVAPEWTTVKQEKYLYTESEHTRVLRPLRDAMRRTSIDPDRIYLSGHHLGGDAVWDIALAHPDYWAGAILIGGDCNKYSIQYTSNGRYVPTYFVVGEIDGAPSPMKRNGEHLDDFLKSSKFDCMLTLYQGRGRDHFQEELPRIMEWMNLSTHRRGPPPEDIDVVTAREGDRVFWWLESDALNSDAIVNPLLFKPGRTKIEAAKLPGIDNGFRISTLPSKSATIWLSPEAIDFGNKVTIFFKGKRKIADVNPDLTTLMEDVRRRADRKHPYWATLIVN